MQSNKYYISLQITINESLKLSKSWNFSKCQFDENSYNHEIKLFKS